MNTICPQGEEAPILGDSSTRRLGDLNKPMDVSAPRARSERGPVEGEEANAAQWF